MTTQTQIQSKLLVGKPCTGKSHQLRQIGRRFADQHPDGILLVFDPDASFALATVPNARIFWEKWAFLNTLICLSQDIESGKHQLPALALIDELPMLTHVLEQADRQYCESLEAAIAVLADKDRPNCGVVVVSQSGEWHINRVPLKGLTREYCQQVQSND